MKKKNTLKKEDWIKGGFRALTKGGEQGIRIEAIAREMKVSKGSFYWHFKDVAALKDAMLEHWAMVATSNVIARLAGDEASAEERLGAIIRLYGGAATQQYGGLKSEGAIRNWARHDKKVAKIFAKVEAARLQFLTELFLQFGHDVDKSKLSARLFYAALVGEEHLAVQGLADMEKDMLAMLDRLL